MTTSMTALTVVGQMHVNSCHFRNGLPVLADHHEGEYERELAALAAVTELIEADQEYDEAMREAHSGNEFSLRAQQSAMSRLVAARARRKKALRAVLELRA